MQVGIAIDGASFAQHPVPGLDFLKLCIFAAVGSFEFFSGDVVRDFVILGEIVWNRGSLVDGAQSMCPLSHDGHGSEQASGVGVERAVKEREDIGGFNNSAGVHDGNGVGVLRDDP